MTDAGLERWLSGSATPMLIVTDTVLGCTLVFFNFLGGFWGRFLPRKPNRDASIA
jgi:hypothetical protein